MLWLQDLDAWAAVVARLLVPGGRLVLFEGHPFEWLVDGDDDGHWALTDYDYFAGPEASRGWSPGFIDHLSIPDGEQHWKFSRAWTLGEVVTAVAGAGLRVERLVEYPRDWWSGHGDIVPEERGRLPLSFGLVATRPLGPVHAAAARRANHVDRAGPGAKLQAGRASARACATDATATGPQVPCCQEAM